LEFCDLKTRANGIFTCKRYQKMLTTDSSFRWRLERLHIEHGVYYSSPLELSLDAPQEDKPNPHKILYLNLIQKKMLWREDHEQSSTSNDTWRHDQKDQFKINVSVRFKPRSNRIPSSAATHAATLPLHQRLALIRLNHKLESNSQALSILKERGEWFKDKWSSLAQDGNVSNDDASRSCDKEGESEEKEESILSCGITSIDPDENNILVVDQTKGLRNFEFDQIFPDSTEQQNVYEKTVHPIICDFLNAINVSCLVFGVTGSGKTYTMFGPEGDVSMKGKQFEGIVPRACAEVFDAINYRSTHLNFDIVTKTSVSYVEVYGDRIGDLLRKGTPCSSNRAASYGFVMNGAAERSVSNVSEVMEALKIGERQKRKAATAMNDRSSRAHSIFIITLTQDCRTTGICRTSKLFLVDLGGCEQTKKSEIISGKSKHFERLKQLTLSNSNTENTLSNKNLPNEEKVDEYSVGFQKSERMREAVNINLGLMSLKACVNALRAGKENKYIPYSQSKLTMMLSTALGGNSKMLSRRNITITERIVVFPCGLKIL
jgi:kinesin family protein 5